MTNKIGYSYCDFALASRADAEAAPGLSDDDAVAGIVGVVADLDGKVDAKVADVLGEGGDVLGALVPYTGDAVLILKDAGRWLDGDDVRRWRLVASAAAGALVECGVDEGGVGDAAAAGEKLAALALDLVGIGFAVEIEVQRDARSGGHAERGGSDLVLGDMQVCGKMRHGSDHEHS